MLIKGKSMIIKCTIQGLEGIYQEYHKNEQIIKNQIPIALDNVGSDMKNRLQKYIHEIWYLGYTPSVYERRTDDNSLGVPLGDDSYIDISTTPKMEGNVAGLVFSYEPKGDHVKTEWHDRDNDALIEFLQLGKGKIPPRPFWNSFVAEMQSGGAIESFIRNMAPIVVVPDGADDLDMSESNLYYNGIISILDNSENLVEDDSDELPF